jgi:hypothetical protein
MDRPVISETSEQENPDQIPDLLHEAIGSWEEMAWLIEQYLPRLQSTEKWLRKAAGQKAEQKRGRRTAPKKTRKK